MQGNGVRGLKNWSAKITGVVEFNQFFKTNISTGKIKKSQRSEISQVLNEKCDFLSLKNECLEKYLVYFPYQVEHVFSW
jgi:hypothetical protein